MPSEPGLIYGIPTRARRLYRGYIFDLDGTTYLGDRLLPTVVETIATLRGLGRRIAFLSNNPTHTRADYVARLNQLGLAVTPHDIIHSSLVMANFLQRHMPGARLFVVGEEPLKAELSEAGFAVVDSAQVDAVIASFDRTFHYAKLQTAFDAIRAGARFFATNGDRYCPVPGGGQPDAAAIIAAIEACTATSVEAVVGKPSRHTVEAILNLLDLPAEDCIMTGDRLETDVLMGLNSGMDAALALTVATPESALATSPVRPTYALRELADLLPAQ
ncbi:MAG: HAD-IIA family hydrolase [Nitrososphaerales archaeon]